MPFVKRLTAEERVGLTDEQVSAIEHALANEARRQPCCGRYSCNCAQIRATDAHAERVAMGKN